MKILTVKTIKSLSIVVLLLTLALPGWAEEWPPLTTPSDAPPARYGHTMTNVGNHVYLFGGMVPGNPNPQNDVWEFSAGTNTWSEVFATGSIPPGRHSHTATAVNDKLYVYGGMDGSFQPESDMWVFDPSSQTWSQLDTGGVPG